MTTDKISLKGLRDRIDAVDRQLVLALAERQRLIEAAARLKGDIGAVQDCAREREVMTRVHAAALASGLSPAVALPLWRLMIARFTRHQVDWLKARALSPDPAQTQEA